MILDHDDYRTYLKCILAERVARNGNYSLRSFAKSLDMPHSTLSLVLRGSMDITHERSLEISRKLGLTQTEQNHFLYLVEIGKVKGVNLMGAQL